MILRCEGINISGNFYRNKCKSLVYLRSVFWSVIKSKKMLMQCSRNFVGPSDMSDKNSLRPRSIFELPAAGHVVRRRFLAEIALKIAEEHTFFEQPDLRQG